MRLSAINNSNSKRILIIEDDNDILTMEKDALEIAGHKVYGVGSGLQAEEILAKEKIDLIVLDLRLPNVDGREFLKKLRKIPSLHNISILVCSASGHKEDVIKCGQHGVKDYLVKPFRLKVFVDRVNRLLGVSLPCTNLNPESVEIHDNSVLIKLADEQKVNVNS